MPRGEKCLSFVTEHSGEEHSGYSVFKIRIIVNLSSTVELRLYELVQGQLIYVTGVRLPRAHSLTPLSMIFRFKARLTSRRIIETLPFTQSDIKNNEEKKNEDGA